MSLKQILKERFSNGPSDALKAQLITFSKKMSLAAGAALVLGNVGVNAAHAAPQGINISYEQNHTFPKGPAQPQHSFLDQATKFFTGSYNGETPNRRADITDLSNAVPDINVPGATIDRKQIHLVGKGAEPVFLDEEIRLENENSSAQIVDAAHHKLGELSSVDGINGNKLLRLSVEPDVLKNPANFDTVLNKVSRFAQVNRLSLVVPDAYQNMGVKYFDFSDVTGAEKQIVPISASMQSSPAFQNRNLAHQEVSNDTLKEYGISAPAHDALKGLLPESDNLISFGDVNTPNGLVIADRNDNTKYLTLKENPATQILEGNFSPALLQDKALSNKLVDVGTQFAFNNDIDTFRLPTNQVEALGAKYYNVAKLSGDTAFQGPSKIYPISATRVHELGNLPVNKIKEVSPQDVQALGQVHLNPLQEVHLKPFLPEQPVHLRPLTDIHLNEPSDHRIKDDFLTPAEKARFETLKNEHYIQEVTVDNHQEQTQEKKHDTLGLSD